jgi:hypothetical protein
LLDEQKLCLIWHRRAARSQNGYCPGILPIVDDPGQYVGISASRDGCEHIAFDNPASIRDSCVFEKGGRRFDDLGQVEENARRPGTPAEQRRQ